MHTEIFLGKEEIFCYGLFSDGIAVSIRYEALRCEHKYKVINPFIYESFTYLNSV